MKNTLKIFSIIILILIFNIKTSYAQEKILNYDQEIQVNVDGSLNIKEQITVKAEGRKIKRGIYRDIPTTGTFSFLSNPKANIEIISILKNGKFEDFHTQVNDKDLRIYIGNQDRYLSPGIYKYEINYKTDNQLRYFDDFDEIYYNVTGNGWDFSIDSATSVIRLPRGAHIINKDAYTGPRGAKGKNFNITEEREGYIKFSTTKMLQRGEGLTVAVSFPKGLVYQKTQKELLIETLKDSKLIFLSLAFFISTLIYLFRSWKKFGIDPMKRVYPRYSPPKGLSACEAGHLMRKATDQKGLTALMIEMANKGFITIEDKGNKKFILTKKITDKQMEKASDIEKQTLNFMFGEDSSAIEKLNKIIGNKAYKDIIKEKASAKDTLEISPYSHELRMSEAYFELIKSLKEKFKGKLYFKNYKHVFIGLLLSLASIVSLVLGIAHGDVETIAPSIFLMIFIAIPALISVDAIRKLIREKDKSQLGVIIFLSLFLVFALLMSSSFRGGLFIFSFWLVLLIINCIFAYALEKYSPEGREIVDHIEGFKIYLKLAEKDRLEFFTKNRLNQEKFEEFLPYAVALGVENSWAKGFDAYLNQNNMSSSNPSWYHSSTGTSFANNQDFAKSISSSFSGSLSSSSGSTSGGSSGGGGGGGGGGGW